MCATRKHHEIIPSLASVQTCNNVYKMHYNKMFETTRMHMLAKTMKKCTHKPHYNSNAATRYKIGFEPKRKLTTPET